MRRQSKRALVVRIAGGLSVKQGGAANRTAVAIDRSVKLLMRADREIKRAVQASRALGEFEITGEIRDAARKVDSALDELFAAASEVEDYMEG